MGAAVRPLGDQRLVDIGDGEQSHRHRELVGGQATWVAASVHPFVVGTCDRCERAEPGHPPENPLAQQRVLFEPDARRLGEWSRLVQNPVGDRKLADVVHQEIHSPDVAAELTRLEVLVHASARGWVATDMGGAGWEAGRRRRRGIVWAAALPDDGPSGGFFQDRRPIAW